MERPQEYVLTYNSPQGNALPTGASALQYASAMLFSTIRPPPSVEVGVVADKAGKKSLDQFKLDWNGKKRVKPRPLCVFERDLEAERAAGLEGRFVCCFIRVQK